MKILITGGTGFLGRRLARALAPANEVVIGGRNNKQNIFAEQFTGCPVIPLDVTRIESVRDAIVETTPDLVIHAAASKFVDRAEREPMECIDVNVRGSQNVARVSRDRGISAVIGISTDKASPPVRNTYGLSKALMERLFAALDRPEGTRFANVRYGNVAWSTGSVLPVWRGMHERSGVIGTTGPDMRRFFFTVDEAVQLVLTALEHLSEVAGAVLTRDMRAARIRDVLDVWISRRGGSWEQIEGRPGERDDEFLIGESELPYASERMFGGKRHYVIRFNERAGVPLSRIVSSATAPRLTAEEIAAIIDNPPPEER